MMKRFASRGLSVFSALSVSACCTIPLMLAAAGVGGAAAGAALGRYNFLLLGVGAAGLAGAYTVYFRERAACRRSGCPVPGSRLTLALLIGGTLAVTAFGAMAIPSVAGLGEAGALDASVAPVRRPAAPGEVVIPVSGMT